MTQPARTFEQAWAEMEKQGYQYGEDALEQVRFGWELAQSQPVMRAAVTAEQAQQDALWALNRANRRTEAEQRVLEAWGKVKTTALVAMRGIAFFPDLTETVEAELARRREQA